METAPCPFGLALEAQVGACQQELSREASAGSRSEQTAHKARLCVHRLEGNTLEHRPFVRLPGYGSYLISPEKKSMKARFSTHRNTLEARGAPKVPVAAAEGSSSASWGVSKTSASPQCQRMAALDFTTSEGAGALNRGSSHLGVRPGSQPAGRKLALQGTGNFSGKAGEVGFVFGSLLFWGVKRVREIHLVIRFPPRM